MNTPIEKLVKEMLRHEGYMSNVYSDSLGFKTVGVGHLVRPSDDEYFMEVGMPVSDWKVMRYFFEDVATAIELTQEFFPEVATYPEDVQLVLVNMMFNLGPHKFSGFRNMIAAIDKRDWQKAADEMVDSKWYHQVGRRSKELVAIMRNVK